MLNHVGQMENLESCSCHKKAYIRYFTQLKPILFEIQGGAVKIGS